MVHKFTISISYILQRLNNSKIQKFPTDFNRTLLPFLLFIYNKTKPEKT